MELLFWCWEQCEWSLRFYQIIKYSNTWFENGSTWLFEHDSVYLNMGFSYFCTDFGYKKSLGQKKRKQYYKSSICIVVILKNWSNGAKYLNIWLKFVIFGWNSWKMFFLVVERTLMVTLYSCFLPPNQSETIRDTRVVLSSHRPKMIWQLEINYIALMYDWYRSQKHMWEP